MLVYGDCAINPDPSADELAEIACQSADSARSFGIDPRVAMISYSTGTSGTGSDVDKVRAATLKVMESRPDLLVEPAFQILLVLQGQTQDFNRRGGAGFRDQLNHFAVRGNRLHPRLELLVGTVFG